MPTFTKYLKLNDKKDLLAKYQFYKHQFFSELSYLFSQEIFITIIKSPKQALQEMQFLLLHNYLQESEASNLKVHINFIQNIDELSFQNLSATQLFVIDIMDGEAIESLKTLNFQSFTSSVTEFNYLVNISQTQLLKSFQYYFDKTKSLDNLHLDEDLAILNKYYQIYLLDEQLNELKQEYRNQIESFEHQVSQLQDRVSHLNQDNDKLAKRYESVKHQLSYRVGNTLVTSFKDKKSLSKLPVTLVNEIQDFYQEKGDTPQLVKTLNQTLKKTLNLSSRFGLFKDVTPQKKQKKIANKSKDDLSIPVKSVSKKGLALPTEIANYSDVRVKYLERGDIIGFYQYTLSLLERYPFELFENVLYEVIQVLYFEEKTELSDITKNLFSNFFTLYLQQRNTKKLAEFFLDFIDILGFDQVIKKLSIHQLSYQDIFTESRFLDLVITQPQAIYPYLNKDFYQWLYQQNLNPEIFSIQFVLALLNNVEISSTLAKVFFDIRKVKTRAKFLARMQRYSYIAKQYVETSFFNDDILDHLHSYENFLYVAFLLSKNTPSNFVNQFMDKVKVCKGTLGFSELDLAYFSSQVGNNKPLVQVINHSFANASLVKLTQLPTTSIKDIYQSLLSLHKALPSISQPEHIAVILSTFEPNIELLSLSIESILNQSYQNLALYVVDDASSNGSDIKALIDTKADPRVHYLKISENSGVYNCRNYAIMKSNSDYIAFQDDDDISHPQRLEYQLQQLKTKSIDVSMTSSLRIDESGYLQMDNNQSIISNAPVTMMFKRELIDKVGEFKPFRSRGDVEFKSRVTRLLGPSAVSINSAILYYSLGSHQSLSSSFEHGRNISNLKMIRALTTYDKTVPNTNKLKTHERTDKVIACMASFPARKEKMLATINSIVGQVDQIYLYLNNYESIPDELAKYDNIEVVLGINSAGDLRDNGKIYPFNHYDIKGYCFLMDDDIIYPVSYFNEFIKKIDLYHRQAVVGVHGVIFAKPFENYFENRTIFHFKNENVSDVVVNQLGTGALGFHTDTLIPNLTNYLATGMADVFFAIEAKRHKIPLICIAHPAEWIKPLDIEIEDNSNLYDEFKHNHSLQTKYIKEAGVFTESSIISILAKHQ